MKKHDEYSLVTAIDRITDFFIGVGLLGVSYVLSTAVNVHSLLKFLGWVVCAYAAFPYITVAIRHFSKISLWDVYLYEKKKKERA